MNETTTAAAAATAEYKIKLGGIRKSKRESFLGRGYEWKGPALLLPRNNNNNNCKIKAKKERNSKVKTNVTQEF